MKRTIGSLIFICSLSVFAQNTEATDTYDQVILDGKTAYINVRTGEIITNKPKNFVSSTSVVDQIINKPTITTAPTKSEVVSAASTHIISKGETLYSISKKYNTSIAELKALNPDISLDTLSVDQEIRVSEVTEQVVANKDSVNEVEAVASKSSTYEVQKGDTLYSISRKFGISVSDLTRLNSLTSNTLSIGQTLNIK
ncbi:hypothetical protein SCB49_12920 [unidentified eubacterium SCB49]|nr:hypothetical protein SCB49_12920 [unidentified eubacterium SCB49]